MTQEIFAIYGDAGFAPHYVPNRCEMGKERNLNREDNFCGGEDVEDIGAKNREIHASGWMRASELQAFNDLLDYGEPVELIYTGWSGEVNVKDGDFEGPIGRDAVTKEFLFRYSLNLVSTGLDEADAPKDDIISEGN